MAHITLDGVTIPVNSVSESPKETGHRTRSFNGTQFVSRQNTKREWPMKTPWMLPTEAEMVRGIVQGAGQSWSLEQGALYTTKGVPPQAATSYALPAALAADGAGVIDEYGDAPVYFGGYALSHYNAAVENELPADARDAEGATGAYSVGGTACVLAMDTSNYWQGAQSVEATYNGVGTTAFISAFATGSWSAADVISGSVYLKGAAGGEIVSVYFRDTTNATNGTPVAATLSATSWTRVACLITIGGSPSASLRLTVQIATPSNEVVYCDGWQVEEAPMASQWYDGTPPSMSLYYDYSVITPRGDLTISSWIHMPDQSVLSSARAICAIYPSGATKNTCLVYRRADTADGLQWSTRSPSGSLHTLDYGADTIWATGWHHVALVMMHNPDTGRFNKEMYLDGTLVGSATTANIPDFVTDEAGTVTLMSDSSSGGSKMHGTLDQFRLLPYALTADAIASLYASTVGAGETPEAILDGDGIAPTSATVIGQVGSVDQVLAGTGYRKSVSFDLREV